jgi:16S rRNA (guanine1516-N2)-methyltransferase
MAERLSVGLLAASSHRAARLRAAALSRELGLPLAHDGTQCDALLAVQPDRLALRLKGGLSPEARERTFHLDWASLDVWSPAGRSGRQPLLKAVRGKRPAGSSRLLLDATAGWGEDAWLLASWGYRVLAVEQSPAVYALLRDAWARMGVERFAIASRIRTVRGDALGLMRSWREPSAGAGCEQPLRGFPPPDIVYLDPMFPGRERRRAKERLPMQVLRLLVDADPLRDEALLGAALNAARRRVVVKRPKTAPSLLSCGRGPVHRVEGKGFRFDIYIPGASPGALPY